MFASTNLNFSLNRQYTGRGRNISTEDLGNLTNLFTDAWFTYGIDRCVIARILKNMEINVIVETFRWNVIAFTGRYLDFHLEHSQGKLFQYVNAHVNDYAQVVIKMARIYDEYYLQFNWVRFMSGTKSLPGSVHGDETFLQFSPNFGFPARLVKTKMTMKKANTNAKTNA